jgi:hypothetical protein
MGQPHFEKAAEFCRLVGKPDLLDYLGVPHDFDPEEAREKLRERRKYLQGMQANPKFKNEAVTLIKNFAALEQTLTEGAAYHEHLRRQAESEHLPIVEMTIRTVLKGGSLGKEQQDYLRKQASDLGVSNTSFLALLTRLAAEHDVVLPADSESPTAPAQAQFEEDLYRLLNIPSAATRDEVYQAYRARHQEARALRPAADSESMLLRLDKAWAILGDPALRDVYDMSRHTTGPPARARDVDMGQQTAPPSRRFQEPPTLSNDTAPIRRPEPATVPPADRFGEPRLEVLGDTTRRFQLGAGPIETTILVRNVGEGQMQGRVTSDEAWLAVQPPMLDPTRREQVITVRVLPHLLVAQAGSGVVTIQTHHGERAGVVFEVVRAPSRLPMLIFGALILGFAIVALAGLAVAAWSGDSREAEPSVTVHIDPTAEQVLLNGVNVGSGSTIYLQNPPNGRAMLEVVQPNFDTYRQELVIEPGRVNVFPVRLRLSKPLEFRPRPGLKQASLDEDFVKRIMQPRSLAMDDCVRRLATEGNAVQGIVRIHVGPSGQAIGVELEGAAASDRAAAECLSRQAAATVFHRFQDGDYATVRYDYHVSGAVAPAGAGR